WVGNVHGAEKKRRRSVRALYLPQKTLAVRYRCGLLARQPQNCRRRALQLLHEIPALAGGLLRARWFCNQHEHGQGEEKKDGARETECGAADAIGDGVGILHKVKLGAKEGKTVKAGEGRTACHARGCAFS